MLNASCSVNHAEKSPGVLKQTPDQSSLMSEDISSSNSQQTLKLPEDFTIGKAIGRGDCFFDAVAQVLNQLKPGTNFTVKSLREFCRKQALISQKVKGKIIADARNRRDSIVVLPEPGIDDDELWKTYLIGIEYSAEDIKKMQKDNKDVFILLTSLHYGSTLQIPICGRPEIEGSIICGEYNVKLHIIKDLCYSGWSSYLIDELGSRSVSTNYSAKDTIHIISKGDYHFDPVLKKEVQRVLPLSNLTQAQSMLSGLPLEKIYEKFASVIEDCSLSENEKIEKLKAFFKACPRLDVNFQVNDRNDTPLHSAVYEGDSKIVKFLLRAGANVNISNNEGNTPIDIAEESNREDIAKVLQPFVSRKEVNVPGDGSCLFWSVALAYLTPVKFDNDTFCERFKKLFTSKYNARLTQRLIQQVNADLYKDNTLIMLVTRVFRDEVANAMYSNREVLKNKISMEDFLESHSGNHFTEGIFKEKFKSKFSAEKVKKYGIDISKLQPNFFDKDTVKEIYTELNKIQNRDQIQEFLFEVYLECMRMYRTWGGEHEISVMSELLETAIIVSQRDSEDYIYNKEKKYCNKIHLSYKGENHYQFYQVKYSNLMKFALSFVQSFEMKLTIYDVFVNTLRNGNVMFCDGIGTSKFVRRILGFSAYTGIRIMSDERASLKVGNVIKATKSFVNLSDLIETFNEYKLGFRKILVDAGCNIFQSFEMQFEKIGLNHVSKVVDDIVNKIIEYYIQKEYSEDLRSIGIAEALVSGKYRQEIHDERVQYGEKSYTLRGLYENIGVAEGSEGFFIYYRKNNEDSQYGYRRSLMGEKSKKIYDTEYTKVQTTNVELENYVYTLERQDFKNTIEQVFYVANKEIQVPSTKRIDDFIVKIKSYIEQEVGFLSKHILRCYQERKESLDVRVRYLVKVKEEIERSGKGKYIRKGKEILERTEKNRNVISLMEEKLITTPHSFYHQKVKEAFVSRAEVISRDYSNLFKCDDTERSRNVRSRIKASSIKALALMFKKMDCKDVLGPVEEFIGRQEQIEEIYRKLQEGAVVIIGPSGIGKTQLARKFVEENKQVYLHAYEVNTQDMLSIESSFASFVRDRLAMSMEEDKDKKRKKYLLLFERAKKEDVEKVLKIRRERGGFDCLFTSSDHGYQDIAEVTLGNLEEEQAKQLVKQILGLVDKSQNEQIKILVGKLKNFPLAIKQAAICIRNRKLSASGRVFGIYEYLAQYEDYDLALPQITGQNEYERVLQITLLISMKAIQEINSTEKTLKIISTMAYFGPGQIDPNLFLTYNRDEDELYSFFELLERYSIIHVEERNEYKVYFMHELIRKAIRSQLSVDEEKQALSYAIRLVCEAEEDFYPYVGHPLSLLYYSREYEGLARENCYLAHMILSALNTLCEYKEALKFGLEAFKVFIITNEETVRARYEIANTMVALGEYDSALQVFWNLKKEETLECTLSFLSVDKEIIFIYFKQKRYENALSYLKDSSFLLTKLPDKKDQRYLNNYLSMLNTIAKILVMQERYFDAFTILHYERVLRDEIFLRRNDFEFYDGLYFYPHGIYGFCNLEAKYTYALVYFFTSQGRGKITVEEKMLPHEEDLSREFNIQTLLNQLQDVLKNQEDIQYLQSAPYVVERKIRKALQEKAKEKILKNFEEVLQLQKEYGFLENNPKVLSVKFYIAILHGQLGNRKKALQELQQVQEMQEEIIGLNHPDTLETVDAIQELFTRDENRLTYLKNEIERRESLLQLKKSDLDARGVSILKEMYAKENSNNYPSVNASSSRELLSQDKRPSDTENIQIKRRKIDNQQQVSELQDCTLPCSVKGQCISPKRRKLENMRVTSLGSQKTENLPLRKGSLIELKYKPNHYDDQMQRFIQWENSNLKKSQQPISSLNSITVEPADNKSLRGVTSSGQVA
ncbi:ankyrin repeat domain-containing protein [Wolbachia endosymbiont of Laodelphax striatellus]|uniref:ankyrin repeat domain-containing protein n=1 Tax=Wolbachia endosymbiont of Laodelphax striatellus TaxID=368602 RepID=UPI0019D64AD6|nr:ankyrin repeat domain-containing protein [Wolbachia endosymbiont of Laodelphax striatellus]